MTKRLLVISVVAILLSGCTGLRRVDYRYYVLDYVPEASKERIAAGPWKTTLLVRNFSLAEPYRRPEMVVRQSVHEVRYLLKDRWSSRPERMIGDMVRRHLREVRLVEGLQDPYQEDAPEYELRGQVLALEAYHTADGDFAHLDLRMDFLRLRDSQVLWRETFDLRRGIPPNKPVQLAAGLSDLLEASMDRTARAFDSLLALEVARP
jgi:ABC-type uncharacterized transport system auxiliary subunit